MEKAYTNITWHNGGQPPVSAENLQAISDGLDLVDDRVIEMDESKLTAATESPELGDVIKWDGSAWVNGPVPGGSGTGTTDYQDLSHKPTINGVMLSGNKTSDELGCVSSSVTDGITSKLTASDNLVFQFSTDGEGNYGYLKADGSFVPFKSGGGGAEPVQIRTSSTWDTVNSKLTISGDFSEKHYAIIEMKYASSSGQTTSAVPKDVSSYICAPANVSSSAQGYVASRSVLFENDKLTINTPTWNNYGLLRNIWVI